MFEPASLHTTNPKILKLTIGQISYGLKNFSLHEKSLTCEFWRVSSSLLAMLPLSQHLGVGPRILLSCYYFLDNSECLGD